MMEKHVSGSVEDQARSFSLLMNKQLLDMNLTQSSLWLMNIGGIKYQVCVKGQQQDLLSAYIKDDDESESETSSDSENDSSQTNFENQTRNKLKNPCVCC